MFCDGKNQNEPRIRATFESHGRRTTFESEYFDEDIQTILDGFMGMLISASWDQRTVLSAMEQYVNDRRSILYPTPPEELEKAFIDKQQ